MHRQISTPLDQEFYRSASETEYATDVLFRDRATLAQLYPLFVRHALSTFQSADVLPFLGKSRPELFNGELKGRLRHRPEGVRLKHVVSGNSLKIYEKEGQILRVETTINRNRATFGQRGASLINRYSYVQVQKSRVAVWIILAFRTFLITFDWGVPSETDIFRRRRFQTPLRGSQYDDWLEAAWRRPTLRRFEA